jgi:hypothetical protein
LLSLRSATAPPQSLKSTDSSTLVFACSRGEVSAERGQARSGRWRFWLSGARRSPDGHALGSQRGSRRAATCSRCPLAILSLVPCLTACYIDWLSSLLLSRLSAVCACTSGSAVFRLCVQSALGLRFVPPHRSIAHSAALKLTSIPWLALVSNAQDPMALLLKGRELVVYGPDGKRAAFVFLRLESNTIFW